LSPIERCWSKLKTALHTAKTNPLQVKLYARGNKGVNALAMMPWRRRMYLLADEGVGQ
jgi:hypothetical protein